MATLLSPCGYALIPAYVTYSLGSGGRLRQALLRAAVVSVGVVIIYTILAVMISLLREVVRSAIPHLALLSALIVMSLGLIKLLEVRLPNLMPVKPVGMYNSRAGNFFFFIFGLGYGLGASGCNLPIFLVVLFYALLGEFGNPLMILMTYALGVVVPLVAVGVIASMVGLSFLRRLSRYTYYIHRIIGFAMVAAGVYLVYFYLTLVYL